MISTNKFHWNTLVRTFSANVSEIENDITMIQVYPDSADVGFDLVSHKTGEIVRMVQSKDWANADGSGWFEFVPANVNERNNLDFKVVIFND